MAAASNLLQRAWSDRFRQPDAAELVAGLRGPPGNALRHARSVLAAEGATERVIWLGTWCWTFAFYLGKDDDRAWAYLIPEPGKPSMCVPVPEGALSTNQSSRLAKGVREALAKSSVVGGVRWPQWEILGKAQVEEPISLARLLVPQQAGASK